MDHYVGATQGIQVNRRTLELDTYVTGCFWEIEKTIFKKGFLPPLEPRMKRNINAV
jgi:hypothetical protein